MSKKGFSHIGLSTQIWTRPETLREHTLVSRYPLRHHKDPSGRLHPHMFFDCGRDQLVAFMEQNIPGMPEDFDTGINRGLGIPGVFYHFAFEAGNLQELNTKREELIGKGVKVTDIVDHEWAMSIYFEDPNGISLEYCFLTRDIGTLDDVTFQERFERSIEIRNGQPVFVRDVQPDPLEAVLADD